MNEENKEIYDNLIAYMMSTSNSESFKNGLCCQLVGKCELLCKFYWEIKAKKEFTAKMGNRFDGKTIVVTGAGQGAFLVFSFLLLFTQNRPFALIYFKFSHLVSKASAES